MGAGIWIACSLVPKQASPTMVVAFDWCPGTDPKLYRATKRQAVARLQSLHDPGANLRETSIYAVCERVFVLWVPSHQPEKGNVTPPLMIGSSIV